MPQSEKVILEAEDQVTPVVNRANAGLDSFEQKAESAHGKVIRITDQTRTSIQRLISSLEKQAETYGKSGVEKLITQRDSLLQRYAKEPQAIDQITKSYEKMIAVEEKATREALAAKAAQQAEEALKKQSAAIQSLGNDVTAFMQNPLQGAQGAISRVTAAIGPFGVGLVAGAASLAAIAVSAFEAAKNLGEYGVRMKDLELRTGLAGKEVEQFGFAARAAGQDVSIFERMMRSLSQAADDTSKDGEKARAGLEKLGITLYDVTGALKPTSEVMTEVSEGLNRLPEGFQRNAVAMDIFKRAGIEAIPVISELSENLRIAKEQGFAGPSEDELKRMHEYQLEVTGLEMSWERMKRDMEVPLVATVKFLFDGLQWTEFITTLPGKILLSGKPTATDIEMGETQGWGYGASLSRRGHRADARLVAENDAAVAAARVSDEKNRQLELAEKKLSELQGELKTGVYPSANQPVLDQIAKQREVVAGLKADAEAKKAAAASGKEFDHILSEAVYHTNEEREKKEANYLAIIQQLHPSPMGQPIEPNAPGGIAGQLLWGAAQQRMWRRPDQVAQLTDWWEGQKVADQAHLGAVTRELALQEHILKLNTDGADLIEQTYALRKKAAEAEYDFNIKYMDREDAANKRDEEYDKARITRQEELLGLQKKQADEEQRQQDAIAKTAGGLFHTLFTKPQSFPKQLRSTLEDAALKPVTETLGGAVANIVHPVSKQDPLKLATDTNTLATAQNSAAVGNLTAVVAAAAGLSAPGIAGVSIPGISGISLPNISIGTPTGTAGAGASFAQRLFPNLPRFGQGGITSGPSIAGEDGPELVIPLGPQLDLRPTMNRPLVGQFGPATDAALEKAATALMSVALPMGLTALGGPGGFSLGEWIMSGLTGAVGAATPARHDNLMMGVVPQVGSMKWAINPKTGGLRLSSFVREGAEEELETHTDWFAKIGLPDSGPGFDKIPRGSVSIDKGKLRILDNGWEDEQQMSPPLTNAQFDELVRKLQQRFPGAQLEMYRDTATGGWVVNKAPKVNAEPIPILFNRTMDNIKAVGRKGGIASGIARKQRALEMAEEQQFSDAVYTGPEPGPIETTHEAAMKLDEQYPWLKGVFDKTAADVARQARGRAGGSAAPRMVRVGDEVMPLGDAAKLLGKSPDALGQWLRNNVSGQDLTAVDLLKVVVDKRSNLPQYDDGGTVATTGVAVVHQGEAVVPQADSLKHSIDGLAGTMQANTGAIRSLFYLMMGQSIFSLRATSAPWAGSGPAASSSSASGYTPAPWAGTGAAVSSSEAVGYSLAPWAGTSAGAGSSWAGTGTAGRSQDSLALAMKMFDPAAVQKTGTTTSLIQSLKNFKNQDWGGFTRSPVTRTYGMDEQGNDVQTSVSGGQITGVHGTAGQALDYGGTMLATQGLLGSRMGTWGGVGEGAAGGAMIGMQMGGPLGAVIGGVAGFGIGVGEKIAGVESPQVKAHNDIKSIYGVDIPTNSGTIKQVVQIAQSQFGNDIAVAVRSPSVRQLVMLYSEATGQKMPLSAATPYAGSLVESGGNLYQQASFQNNAWHTYSSNLPTLGGVGGTTYPTTPGPNTAAGAGPTYLSLNINGQPITSDFVADQSLAAQNASYGRTQQSANLQVPGLMVA